MGLVYELSGVTVLSNTLVNETEKFKSIYLSEYNCRFDPTELDFTMKRVQITNNMPVIGHVDCYYKFPYRRICAEDSERI